MPAYGEIANLRVLLPEIHSTLSGNGHGPAEVVVVLPDFAPETEREEVVGLGGRPILRSPSNSFGDAIRCGLSAVDPGSAWVIIMDADGSHDPSTISRLLDVDESADVVVASRYVDGGSTANSLVLRIMSRALNGVYARALGIDCRDISTNFKRYRGDDLASIELESSDFDVVEELFFRVKVRHGDAFTVVEIPDHFRERASGTTKRRLGPFIISYVVTLVRLRRQAGRDAG
jgi:dolichol-phosphate mannosyltransferase